MSQPFLQGRVAKPGAGSPDKRASIFRFPVLFPSSCHLVRGKGQRGWEKQRGPSHRRLLPAGGNSRPSWSGSTAPPLPAPHSSHTPK